MGPSGSVGHACRRRVVWRELSRHRPQGSRALWCERGLRCEVSADLHTSHLETTFIKAFIAACLSSTFATILPLLMDIRTCSWEIMPPSLDGLPGNSRAEANHPNRQRKKGGVEVIKGLQMGGEGLKLVGRMRTEECDECVFDPSFRRINGQIFCDSSQIYWR